MTDERLSRVFDMSSQSKQKLRQWHQDIQTPRTEMTNTTRSCVFFDEIRGVWMTDERLSREFDMSSQSKQKLKSKRRSKIIKSMLIKTGYANLLHGCDFLYFNLMDI